jgi:serine/threonine protein kinase
MRGNEGSYVLIDLDACAKLSLQYAGSKISSAYIPPEMIYFNETRNEYDVRVSSNAPNVNRADYGYEFVLATTAYDSWSLGIILYFLCVGLSFFYCDRSENIIDQTELEKLHRFTLTFKKEKLSKVDNPQAKNLISQLLNKDPTKRPTMKQVLMHPFLSMKSTARMVGDKAEFDVFLSYRVRVKYTELLL